MEEYKGFKNYQTWAVWNWINNNKEPGLYNYWINETKSTPEINELGEKLQQFFKFDNNPLENKPSLYSDLLMDTLNGVYWNQLATQLKEDHGGAN